MKEQFKDIPGFEGYYQLGNKGSLRHVRFTADCKVEIVRYLHPKYHARQGQAAFVLARNGVHTTVVMHRLMWKIWGPNTDTRLTFKDGNPKNWAINNLKPLVKGSWTKKLTREQWSKMGTKDLSEKRIVKIAEKYGLKPRVVYMNLLSLRSKK